jgi:hypothetical protein
MTFPHTRRVIIIGNHWQSSAIIDNLWQSSAIIGNQSNLSNLGNQKFSFSPLVVELFPLIILV